MYLELRINFKNHVSNHSKPAAVLEGEIDVTVFCRYVVPYFSKEMLQMKGCMLEDVVITL